MHRKHRGDLREAWGHAWERYPGGVWGAPSPKKNGIFPLKRHILVHLDSFRNLSGKVTTYFQHKCTALIFGIWFGVFPIGTVLPIGLFNCCQLFAGQTSRLRLWTVGIASVGTESVGIAWCTRYLLSQYNGLLYHGIHCFFPSDGHNPQTDGQAELAWIGFVVRKPETRTH